MKRYLVVDGDQPLIWLFPIAADTWNELDKETIACPVYYYRPEIPADAKPRFWPTPLARFKVFECSEINP